MQHQEWVEVRCASIGTLTTTLELHEMGYTHLTKEERYQIRAMHEMESSIRQMANVLNRAPSTISRELRRNRGQRGYRPGQADQKACERARTSRTRTQITVQDWAAVAALVRQDWSPE